MQRSQVMAPSTESRFWSHGSQLTAPSSGELLPASHSTHEVCPVAPCALPGKHGMHLVAPKTLEYVPAEHDKHSVSFVGLHGVEAWVPGLQTEHATLNA